MPAFRKSLNSISRKLKRLAVFSGSSRKVAELVSYELKSSLVSILVPVYNPVISDLCDAIDSAANQSHQACEIIVVNDASTDPDLESVLLGFVERYSNVAVVNLEKNLGISGASQVALNKANGDWVGLLDQDDLLEPIAVELMLRKISQFPDAGLAYSDSDKLDANGNFQDTYLKGDWSPERLRGNMYLAHFTFFRRDLAQAVGGFRSEFDGAQDHDLALRISETGCEVVHIPEVLYHWRLTPTSTAMNPDSKPFARDAGRRAIQEHLQRVGISGTVKGILNYPGFYEIDRKPTNGSKVSIVIPTRGTHGTVFGESGALVIRCIQSFVSRPQVSLGEIILVADQVDDLSYLDAAKMILGERLKIVMYDKPFNFSEKVNLGISASINEFVLVLNDDIEMISQDWLDPLVAILEQEDVGGVGPLLRFEDGTIQHGGHYYAHGGATHRYLKEMWSPGYFGDLILDRESSGLTAAFLLIKKSAWNSVGGFSIDLPNNFNDVDFCLKIRDLSFRLIFTPRVEAFHFESKSRESAVQWTEVAKITELWGHFLGATREPFGPGGKPRDFARSNLTSVGIRAAIKKIMGNLYYGRYPLLSLEAKKPVSLQADEVFKSNYFFNLNFPIELENSIKSMINGHFEESVSEFSKHHPKNVELESRTIQIWISANVTLGWNFLFELVKAYENYDLAATYSDYVDSGDAYQSLKQLPGWSRERFLGFHFIGRVLSFDVSDASSADFLTEENFLSKANQILINSDSEKIGRIPEILYRVLSDPLVEEIHSRHLETTANWVNENRPKLEFEISNSMAQYKFASIASGSCSIVIPTRFSAEPGASSPIISKCLSSLIEQNKREIEVEVILVVDKDSFNESNAKLITDFQKFLNIKIVMFSKPFNFSTKCNLGAAESTSDYLIFLNDDTEWLEKDSLREIIGTLSLPNVGAAGALLRYPNGLIQHGGIIFETPGPDHAYVRQYEVHGSLGDLKVLHEVSAVTGACLGIRRLIFEEIGQWNEEYPGSYNDVDLCARISQHGYSIVLNPKSELTHFESLSRNPFPITKDVNRMLSAWLPQLSWERFMRSRDAHGINDQGQQICQPMGPNLSGKYVRYTIYLVRTNGFYSMFAGLYRFVTGTSRRWKSYKKKPSVY